MTPLLQRLVALAVALASAAAEPVYAQEAGGWRADWEVADGFALSIDAEGFRYPTSIAFVPEPGPNPADPLYFVTELRGAVKVVTRDRTVRTFADGFFHLKAEAELPDYRGEVGLVGICLDPQTGAVFVSFAHQDEKGVLRNSIVRFQTVPHTFSVTPTASATIAPVLASAVSARAHQVGAMVIHDRLLYVGVGDGLRPSQSADLDAPLGKILRMTLDGAPAPGNPYAGASGEHGRGAREYVWAYGLRNPFGLAAADDRLFAADNGPGVDRLVAVERGRDYAFDGTDWSMGTNAIAVFAPSVGPAQMAWLPRDSELFPPAYRGTLFVAFGGSTQSLPGPGFHGKKSVVALPLDPKANRVDGGARPVLRYRGEGRQLPVGVAFGPDGLYVAPLFDVRGGTSAILKLRHAPPDAHPFVIDDRSPSSMLASLGCLACHGTYGGRALAPTLEPQPLVERLRDRLFSPDYERAIRAMDAIAESPQADFREARREVLGATGKERVRLWLKHRILEPTFDDPTATMPLQTVSVADADKLAQYFVVTGWQEPWAALRTRLSVLRGRQLGAGLIAGALAGFAAGALLRRRT